MIHGETMMGCGMNWGLKALLALLLSGAANPSSAGQDLVLTLRIDHFSAQRGMEVRALCARLNIPCGMELRGQRTFDFDSWFEAEDISVSSLLDKLTVGPLAGYGWRMRRGVLEIAPKAVLSGKTKSPLDIKIEAIELSDVSPLHAAKSICAQAGIIYTGLRSVVSGRKGPYPPRKISLRLKDVTVREALDELVRKNGRSMWFFYDYPPGEIDFEYW